MISTSEHKFNYKNSRKNNKPFLNPIPQSLKTHPKLEQKQKQGNGRMKTVKIEDAVGRPNENAIKNVA